MKRTVLIIAVVGLCLCAAACSRLMKTGVTKATPLLRDMVDQAERGSDPALAREGLPALLIILDGLLAETPRNGPLLTLASQANMYLALGFLEDEDRDRASLVYWKGKQYGMRALELNKKFAKALADGKSYPEAVQFLSKKDLPALFWTANNWAAWLNMNMRSTRALFDQPKILAMMQRVLELDGSYFYGGAHLFMATYYANLPALMGGGPEKSKQEFEKAFEITNGKFLMVDVFYAQYYAPLVFDKALYVSTLEKVLEAPADIDPDARLMNEIAKKRAKALLARTDTIPW